MLKKKIPHAVLLLGMAIAAMFASCEDNGGTPGPDTTTTPGPSAAPWPIETPAPTGPPQEEGTYVLTYLESDGSGTAEDRIRTMVIKLAWSSDNESIVFGNGSPAPWEEPPNRLGYGYFEFSPDGQNLAASFTPDQSNADIVVWDVDEAGLLDAAGSRAAGEIFSNPTVITGNTGGDFDPTWSPDGIRIAFGSWTDSPSNTEIYTIRADGTGLERLTDNTVGDNFPAWSPAGDKIAFVRNADDGSGVYQDDIFVMHSDGSSQTRLTSASTHDSQPAWSPDGRKIVYTSGPGFYSAEVWVMDADGSNKVQLTTAAGWARFPRWSPGGKMITFTAGGNILVMREDGSQMKFLAITDTSDWGGAWYPVEPTR